MKIHALSSMSKCGSRILCPELKAPHDLVLFLLLHLLPSHSLDTLHHLSTHIFTYLPNTVASFPCPFQGGGTKSTEMQSLLHKAWNSVREVSIHCIYKDELET